ncbi:AAA family ATPase [Rhizorhabdus sp.]|uniref:AAA family ATPase n=1 Tax=Rhizorhabdus sp. TaxID=1968843 RepID=UPI0019BB8865|nr:AAA family ATPase [Rhizorhabdus sp.]MBD3762844.1 AAA family ATPase [Rhizorhabdus sp.]
MAEQFTISTVDVDLPMLGKQRLQFAKATDEASRSTILVGRNGTGKSTILRELAMAFRSYFASRTLKSRQGLGRVSHIGIVSDGVAADLHVGSDSKSFRVERDSLRAEGRGPTKLIALSFTPFDKFPPSDDTRSPYRADIKEPFYVYLGFKNDFRASPRARLLRSIDQLAFAQSSPQSDHRVVEAFDAIGYLPIIEITYTFDPYRLGSARRHIDEPRLKKLSDEIATRARESDNGRRHEIIYLIDFRYGRRDSSIPIDYEEVRELMGANILRLTSVTMLNRDGGRVEMLELSSGELNLLSGFLGLSAFLEDGCLILIDEPENSLHPEWQLRYTEMLDAVLKRHRGCHYIIATHSPLVVSGASNGNTKVLRLDQQPIELAPETVAKESPDATLINAFRLVTPGNNFLKQLTLEALMLIDTGKHRTQRARQIASTLASAYEQLKADDRLRDLIVGIVTTIAGPR